MNRIYVKWFSHCLSREMELLVFGDSGTPVLLFPTRTARFYDYENWRIIDAIKPRIESGELQVFCVDSYDLESFYSCRHPAEKITRHLLYESYIIEEVIPFIQGRNSHGKIVSAGCSLGGYHAVNVALRHPDFFYKAVGMSARYDLTISSDKFPNLLNGYFDENIYFNMPSMFMPNLHDDRLLNEVRNLEVTLVIGNEDPFFQNNEHLAETLCHKQVKSQFFVWNEEAHRAYYWRKMLPLYL